MATSQFTSLPETFEFDSTHLFEGPEFSTLANLQELFELDFEDCVLDETSSSSDSDIDIETIDEVDDYLFFDDVDPTLEHSARTQPFTQYKNQTKKRRRHDTESLVDELVGLHEVCAIPQNTQQTPSHLPTLPETQLCSSQQPSTYSQQTLGASRPPTSVIAMKEASVVPVSLPLCNEPTTATIDPNEDFPSLQIDGIEAEDIDSLMKQFEGVTSPRRLLHSPLKPKSRPRPLTLDDYRKMRMSSLNSRPQPKRSPSKALTVKLDVGSQDAPASLPPIPLPGVDISKLDINPPAKEKTKFLISLLGTNPYLRAAGKSPSKSEEKPANNATQQHGLITSVNVPEPARYVEHESEDTAQVILGCTNDHGLYCKSGAVSVNGANGSVIIKVEPTETAAGEHTSAVDILSSKAVSQSRQRSNTVDYCPTNQIKEERKEYSGDCKSAPYSRSLSCSGNKTANHGKNARSKKNYKEQLESLLNQLPSFMAKVKTTRGGSDNTDSIPCVPSPNKTPIHLPSDTSRASSPALTVATNNQSNTVNYKNNNNTCTTTQVKKPASIPPIIKRTNSFLQSKTQLPANSLGNLIKRATLKREDPLPRQYRVSSSGSDYTTCSEYSSDEPANKVKKKRTTNSRNKRSLKYSSRREESKHILERKARKHRTRRHTQSSSSSCTSSSSSSNYSDDSEYDRGSTSSRGSEFNQVEAMSQRRVIYVGDIPDTYTRSDLRKRFGGFGDIENATIHKRNTGEKYGFVTFYSKADAIAAMEKGNDTFGPKFTLGFGGRRIFCDTEYADLDGCNAIKEEWSAFDSHNRKRPGDDFDNLLHNAIKKMR